MDDHNLTNRVVYETYTVGNGEYELTFSGVILAHATGQRTSHINHIGQKWAAPRQRCSACRWTEVTIYKRISLNDNENENDKPGQPRTSPPHPPTTNPFVPAPVQPSDHPTLPTPRTSHPTYVVYTVGRSRVPQEVDLPKLVETASAYEVVEALTVRKTGGAGEVFIPPQHLRALAAASQWDRDLRDAYINRAIV